MRAGMSRNSSSCQSPFSSCQRTLMRVLRSTDSRRTQELLLKLNA